MNKSFSQFEIFYYVVVNMSFSKAAKCLNCSKAYISNQINDLERSVGSLLIQRNTRTLKLTFAGETLFEHAKLMVGEFRAAENSISTLQDKAQGTLRITAPPGYADYLLAPNLTVFLKTYPDITLEMNFTGALLNLVEENIDIAIRLTHEPPVNRVAKQVGSYQMMVCASKDYLKLNGRPKNPNQLLDHSCLVYSTERNSSQWPFLMNNNIVTIDLKPKISANSSRVLLNAVLSDMGIARLPNYVVEDAVKSEQLEYILNNYYPLPIPIYAIYAQGRIVSPKIHAFIRFLQELHAV